MSLMDMARKSQQIISDHAPVILTGVAIAGTVVTGVLAGRAGFKAGFKVGTDEAVLGVKDGETTSAYRKRIAKETWTLYTMPAVAGVATIASMATANRISTNRLAGLAAAYAIGDKLHEEYQDKVAAVMGEKQEQTKVHDKVVQDRVSNTKQDPQVIMIGEGKVLCYDTFSDRLFESSMEDLKKAQNDTNYELMHAMYVSLSSFYERVGLPSTPYSEELGWQSDDKVELHFTSTLIQDKPVLAITFHAKPVRGYYKESAHG